MAVDEYILNAIKTGVQESLSQVKPDRTYIGNVTQVLGDKEFVVNYGDNDRKIKTKHTLQLTIGDIVHVTVPRDNIKNVYLLEDIVYGNSSVSSCVSSVDGKTGNVILTNSYASKSSEHTHSNKDILDAITSEIIQHWNEAYTHSTSTHAPSDAEKNVIVGIQKNGTDITVSTDRKVNIIVPKNTSDLTNDSNFISDSNYVHTDNNYTSDEKVKLNSLDSDDYGSLLSYTDSTLSLLNKNGDVLKSVTISEGNSSGIETVIGEEPTTKTVNMIWIED